MRIQKFKTQSEALKNGFKYKLFARSKFNNEVLLGYTKTNNAKSINRFADELGAFLTPQKIGGAK